MTSEDNSTKAYIVIHYVDHVIFHINHVTVPPPIQLYSEEKARLMVKQAQLADRGAPAMVLLVLTAKDGEQIFSKIPILYSPFSLPPSFEFHPPLRCR